jgi:cytochrome c-type biogenesis protein CcmH/NrfF
LRRGGWLLALAVLLGTAWPAGAVLGGTEAIPSGVDLVTEKIICDCGCSNLTVKNCTCGKADRVRARVAQLLSEGESPEQILKTYVDEYGEQILAAPTPEGFNLVGWLLPFGAVLIAGTTLVIILRRWARVPWSEAPLVPPLEAAGPARSPDPSFLRRVQKDLEDPEI